MDTQDRDDGSQATSNPADDLPAVAVATELLNRTNTLFSELEAFSALLEASRRPPILGHRGFTQDVSAEKRFIERLLQKAVAETNGEDGDANDDQKDPLDALAADRKIKHQLSSTNITSYEAQWAAVKRCRGIVALRQTFSRQPPAIRRARKRGDAAAATRELSPGSKIKAHVKKTQDGVLVDAVVENGAEWLKVSAVSERQLLFQMARQGWQNDSSDSDDDEQFGKPAADSSSDSDDEDEVVILRLAKHLTAASRAHRHSYRHPRIRLVLPKITPGRVREIDALLARIRALSTPSTPLVLETAPATPEEPITTTTGPPPDLTPLLTDPHASLTPTLNIDCTLLVALASDISHQRVAPQPWHPTAVQGQIRDELRDALLPHTLYPALGGGRALVCTRAAARRMREIVGTIGTEGEVVRAGLLLEDDDDGEEKKREEVLREWQRWSIWPVPGELRLPIRVVDDPEEGEGGTQGLPRVAEAVAAQLTDINRSIFMYGWAAGFTTLSSNGTVAKQIESLVELNRTGDDEVGPDVWVCPVARSLVAKKGRRQN